MASVSLSYENVAPSAVTRNPAVTRDSAGTASRVMNSYKTDGVTSTNGGVTSTSDVVTSTSDGVTSVTHVATSAVQYANTADTARSNTEPQPTQMLPQSLAGDYEDVELAAASASQAQYARLGDDANIDEYESPYTMLNRDAR